MKYNMYQVITVSIFANHFFFAYYNKIKFPVFCVFHRIFNECAIYKRIQQTNK